MLRLVFALAGVLGGALVAFVFDVGAKPCMDLRVVTAACAVPQPATWAVVLCAAAGAVVLPTAAHLATRPRG